MDKSMTITEEVLFDNTIEKVWDLLTNPKMTKQYMFGCEVLSNWTVGDSITWKGFAENGEEVTYVKGKIIEMIPYKKVSFTMFDPNMGIKDIAENYVNLTYQLAELQNGTKLTMVQGDFSGTENAEKRFEESKNGWKMVIPLMKKVI